MKYTEVDCKVHPVHEFTEIIIAYMANMGYTMFEETDHGVKAYIETENFKREYLDQISEMVGNEKLKFEFQVNIPELKNWNEEWENNFKPVIIGKEIYVRAEYHKPDPSFKFELVIHPRMAFGTGHHATTAMMMENMLQINFENTQVLDMGCGTGILAILAAKLKAAQITGIDFDINAVENAIVNCNVNHENEITILHGDAKTPLNRKFDIILANINRNIILEDLPLYVNNMNVNGLLLTSGYYTADYNIIAEAALRLGLINTSRQESENWCQATFFYNKF